MQETPWDAWSRRGYAQDNQKGEESMPRMGFLTILAVRFKLSEKRMREVDRIINHGDWKDRVMLYLLLTNPGMDMVGLGYEDPPEEADECEELS